MPAFGIVVVIRGRTGAAQSRGACMSRTTPLAGPKTAVRSTLSAIIGAGALLLLGPVAAHADACVTGVVASPSAFSFTGADQCYVVPAGVATVHIAATGASTPTGLGATVIADVPVLGGHTLYVEVGGTPSGASGA